MSNDVTDKSSREDIDWRVEQKLAKILAERDLYRAGIWHGIEIAVLVLTLIWIFWPEIKKAK